jgi:hypothetical protein
MIANTRTEIGARLIQMKHPKSVNPVASYRLRHYILSPHYRPTPQTNAACSCRRTESVCRNTAPIDCLFSIATLP